MGIIIITPQPLPGWMDGWMAFIALKATPSFHTLLEKKKRKKEALVFFSFIKSWFLSKVICCTTEQKRREERKRRPSRIIADCRA